MNREVQADGISEMPRLWDNCPRCRELRREPDKCRCACFEVQHDWSADKAPWSKEPDEGNWSQQWAIDAEDAAEKFAEHSDSDGDYTIIRSGSGRLWVRDSEGAVTRWDVQAESRPHYSVSEAKS